MNPWFGRAALLVGFVVSIIIRAPHDGRSATVKIAESRKGGLELVLIGLMMVGMLILPLISIATPAFAFADYPLHPISLSAGIAIMVFSQWLFYRSHADLGTNWSVSLEVRENHQLITSGVYKQIRHPMYTAIFAYTLGQALLLPNGIAGPASFVAFLLMFVLRLRPEERMMRERFGAEYEAYVARTKRLVPRVF